MTVGVLAMTQWAFAATGTGYIVIARTRRVRGNLTPLHSHPLTYTLTLSPSHSHALTLSPSHSHALTL